LHIAADIIDYNILEGDSGAATPCRRSVQRRISAQPVNPIGLLEHPADWFRLAGLPNLPIEYARLLQE
jgi:hypothetical protein